MKTREMSLDHFSCMLCGETDARPWLTDCPDYYLQKEGAVDYVECAACSLVQQHPLPTDIGALYADYPVHTSRSAIQRLARRLFQRQVYFQHSENSKKKTLLDYGCGDGTFLFEVEKQYKSICGFEPDDAHADALSKRLNAPIYSSTDQLRAENTEVFDVVTSHFVVEHLDDLREAFETFQTILKPSGLLYIAVPNIRSWEARLFKKRWHGLDAPRHLVFPDTSHIKKLAEEFGFEPPTSSFAAFPNTLAASLATVLSGRCHSGLLMAFILPSWLISLITPSGTVIFKMRKGR